MLPWICWAFSLGLEKKWAYLLVRRGPGRDRVGQGFLSVIQIGVFIFPISILYTNKLGV